MIYKYPDNASIEVRHNTRILFGLSHKDKNSTQNHENINKYQQVG